MNFKKLWNNRTFRTFVQTVLGTLSAYIVDYVFELNSKKMIALIIMSVATGVSKIMPLFDEKVEIKEEEKVND